MGGGGGGQIMQKQWHSPRSCIHTMSNCFPLYYWHYPYELQTGAFLANGRGGRKTTLWSVQNRFFDKKLVISCLPTNLTRWFERSFIQNTAVIVLRKGFWTLCEYILRKLVRKMCPGGDVVERWGELRPPLSWFLEWPLECAWHNVKLDVLILTNAVWWASHNHHFKNLV